MVVKIKNTPSPDVLMNSLRSKGYNFRTSLADIINNSGTPIKVNYLLSKLAVSDRTIQIKELVNERLIKIEPCSINGRQFSNKITYIGTPRIKTGKKLTLGLLYDMPNPYGFREWDWMDFKLHPD